jgi:group I intron endonuclease
MTYIYTLSDGEKIRYVGKTKFITKRYQSHINESKNKRTYKEKWINNVLLNNGKIVLEILDICDDDVSNEIESYWINQMKCWGFNLVNLTIGGDGNSPMLGKKHTKESKIKMSEVAKNQNRKIGGWNKGLKMSDEFKQKVRVSSKGRVVSDETRKKISDKLKGYRRGPMSEETKLKISISKQKKESPNKGKKYSDEIRKKMSISKLGKKRTKESIEKQSESLKIIWTIKNPNGDILKFLGYNSFKDYVKKNKINVSLSTLKSYGKNKGWIIIKKQKK